MSESGGSGGRVTFDEPERPRHSGSAPPAYGDEGGSALALPVNRLSESSRSDGSSGEHGVYATTTTTTHTVHTTTTIFRLPRRKKPGPLFPLPPKVATESSSSLAVPAKFGSVSSSRGPSMDSAALRVFRIPGAEGGEASPMPSPSQTAMAKAAMMFAAPGSPVARSDSTHSNRSNKSSPTRSRLGLRGRSSTLNSLRNVPSEEPLETPQLPSSRTSTSTGRKSFGDLFNMTRLRASQDPMPAKSGHDTPNSGSNSKTNSMQLSREPVVIPERHQEDTPAKYLLRLEEAVSRGVVASVLSKGSDQFSQQVLRSYMRGFGFFGDPMDMALRKLLMEVELPKETQHIDRCLQAFAHRYHECNPGIYASPDQAYFIAFSLLILHTDVFNKNNKHKMQKQDYVRNTQGEGIFDEILECFYDNISYTPFIHVEDDLDINGERIVQHKTKKKSLFPRNNMDPSKRPLKEPIDPYTLIIDSRLDTLRPNLKDVMNVEEHYNYLGTAQSLNLDDLQKTFFRTGVLQIISARSRPDAFMSDKTVLNPEEAHPGIVDIKITKVGLLWRKDVKKKKTRSPWQEWGAILTGAQLYFFRNTAWIKSLMHQHESHVKQGHDSIPVIFKPPIDSFKPDALMSTDDAVALLDKTYKKHKNAFLFVRHGGFEETFLADNEDEMNDWLAKLNYAAAFRTAGVRMRGVVGGNYEGQRTRGMRRLDSSNSSRSIQTPTGEVTISSGKIDFQMAQEILAARREIMLQKISQADEKLAVSEKQLDAQLRNARHLQILAPIQAKTREQVLIAAARMAAKMKWVRMEMWRLRCHRDILSMDLEEEKNNSLKMISDSTPTPVETPSNAPDQSSLARMSSQSSTILTNQRSPRSPILRPATQPVSPKDKDFGMEDIFQGPPMQHSSSFHKAQASWELPLLKFEGSTKRQSSKGPHAPRSPVLTHTSSFPSMRPSITTDTQRAVSNPNEDAGEQTVLEQAGFVDTNRLTEPRSTEKEPEEGLDKSENMDKEKEKEKEKDKSDRNKIRRSLHRTLREAHIPTQHRSRKGRESGGNANSIEEAATDDVLARGSGSFVVHGKKASVITFGEELSNMSPDIRQKKPQKEVSGPQPRVIAENDFVSSSIEPIEFHEHRLSAASSNTATARSFRELHKRLSTHAATLGPTDDGDDSEAAVSFSDGRRTPLPPVEDMDEDEGLFPGATRQAAFYTPEPPGSPSKAEKEEEKQGPGRSSTPPILTIVI
jgi:hypothetical protein